MGSDETVEAVLIVNEFLSRGPDDPAWPALGPFDDYYGKKLCALADRIARMEAALRWLHDFFTVDASMSVLGETLQKTLLAQVDNALEQVVERVCRTCGGKRNVKKICTCHGKNCVHPWPWRTCPECGGTGKEADDEQD